MTNEDAPNHLDVLYEDLVVGDVVYGRNPVRRLGRIKEFEPRLHQVKFEDDDRWHNCGTRSDIRRG